MRGDGNELHVDSGDNGKESWRKRGHGSLKLFYNHYEGILRLEFTDNNGYDKVCIHGRF